MSQGETSHSVDPERRKAFVIWLAVTTGALLVVLVLGFLVTGPGELGSRMSVVPLVLSALSLLVLVLAVVLPPRLRVASGAGRTSPTLVRFIAGLAMIEAAVLLRVASLLAAGQRPTLWTVVLVPVVFSIYFPSDPCWSRLSRAAPSAEPANKMVR